MSAVAKIELGQYPADWVLVVATALTMTAAAAAAAALTVAVIGVHLAGGSLELLRNLAGMTGIGLLCAAVAGGGLAWVGPTGYLVVGAYGLYTLWHGPPLTTPWIWPARPPHDVGGAICAAPCIQHRTRGEQRARSPRSGWRMRGQVLDSSCLSRLQALLDRTNPPSASKETRQSSVRTGTRRR